MVLLEFLKKNDNARKIFGKRELRIIEKQLLGLTLKQSEKNRLSRDIRKKFEFIKEATKYADEFGLKHGTKIKEFIARALDIIREDVLFYKVNKIILFGSTVIRRRHLGSDIDIAVEFDSIELDEATKFRIRTLGRLSDKIDVQVYNVLPENVKNEIDENGRILFTR